MSSIKFTIKSPQTIKEFEGYYRLRWQILREPWGQLPGSEKDEFEKNSFHIIAVVDGRIIGVGRLHSIGAGVSQIRYMAIDEKYRNKGVGSAIIEAIEKQAILCGVKKIILDARENATGFYQKKSYRITAPSHTLFGAIKHFRMEKVIGK